MILNRISEKINFLRIIPKSKEKNLNKKNKNKIIFPAEWHPQFAVQFTFPHANSDWADKLQAVEKCFVEMISTVAQFEKVIVVCSNIVEVKKLLKDIPETQLILKEIPSNDTWARDHGGITVFETLDVGLWTLEKEKNLISNVQSPTSKVPVIYDFTFNGWGMKFPADKDNLITRRLFRTLDFGLWTLEHNENIEIQSPKSKVQSLEFIFEGGGIESDGEGTLMTTSECLLSPNRNGHLSKTQITRKLKKYFGAERVLWLNNGYLAGDDTDSHIDTLARFCAPDLIAYVKCDDKNDEHYAALQAMEKELKNFRTAEKKPYRLKALPMPDACYAEDGHRLPATYANFLIINGAVLVPTYGVKQDDAALAILATCFPDRKIIGINCRILIEQHGSLHCATMQYPKFVG